MEIMMKRERISVILSIVMTCMLFGYGSTAAPPAEAEKQEENTAAGDSTAPGGKYSCRG